MNCPFCKSDQTEGDAYDTNESGGVEQGQWCNDCGAAWRAYYTFYAYSVTDGPVEPIQASDIAPWRAPIE